MRSASLADRKLAEFILQGYEVFWRSGNQGGKTQGGARYGIALVRGKRAINCGLIGGPDHWVKLPVLDLPITHWVLSKTYKQQVDAVQSAYLRLLGHHGVKVGWINRALNYIGVIMVRPDNWDNNDPESWSRIVFHCEQGDSSIGGRIDSCHADEPPSEKVWREIRARGRANKPFIRYITATPLYREEWEWLRRDFGEHPDIAANGRVEIRSGVRDNLALNDEHIRKLLEAYEGDSLIDARIDGEYIDTTGACPFNYRLTSSWLKLCKPGWRESVIVQGERTTEDGRTLTRVACESEIWEPCEADEDYLCILDPSTGVNDKKHDPAHLIVGAVHRPRIVYEYSGYCGAYALGSLAALVGARYNNALVDLDTTGGYGQLCFTGMAASKYRYLMQDTHPDQPGVYRNPFGFSINANLKGEFVASIQQALVEDSIRVWSRHIVETLRGITVDSVGRPISVSGRKDEALTTFGRYAYLLQLPGTRAIRRSFSRRRDAPSKTMAAALRRDFGRDVLKPTSKSKPQPVDRFR
jgi:hypothetical protein